MNSLTKRDNKSSDSSSVIWAGKCGQEEVRPMNGSQTDLPTRVLNDNIHDKRQRSNGQLRKVKRSPVSRVVRDDRRYENSVLTMNFLHHPSREKRALLVQPMKGNPSTLSLKPRTRSSFDDFRSSLLRMKS